MNGGGRSMARTYGAAIALVSGGYSLLSATTGVKMGAGEGMTTLGRWM